MTDDSDDSNYCEEHEVDIDALPKDYDHCPYCREEERIRAQEIHYATRDPTIEPW